MSESLFPKSRFHGESSPSIGLDIDKEILPIKDGQNFDEVVLKSLRTKAIFASLPETVRGVYEEYADNTTRFVESINIFEIQKRITGERLIYKNRYGNEESGLEINFDKLEQEGIDPKKVLVFRITSSEPPNLHTEAYWTTDVDAFLMMYEYSEEMKSESYILISTLSNVAGDGTVNIDRMDTSGASIHRMSNENLQADQLLGYCKYLDLLER